MLSEKMETLLLSPQQHSLFLPDSESSSEASVSGVTSGDLSTRRSALNHFLDMSGVDCVKQSKKKFSDLQPRSQKCHESK